MKQIWPILSCAIALWLFSPAPPAVAQCPGGGTCTVRTYNSSVDGVAIQYREYIPAGYDPTLPYPVLAYLHGGGGTMTAVPSDILAAADVYQYIVVSIDGRPLNFTPQGFCQGQILCASPFYFNSPITGPGEQDVLDMLADVKRLRLIDDARVYLAGFSMAAGAPGESACAIPESSPP